MRDCVGNLLISLFGEVINLVRVGGEEGAVLRLLFWEGGCGWKRNEARLDLPGRYSQVLGDDSELNSSFLHERERK